MRWLIMTSRMHRERGGQAGRMHGVTLMSEALVHMVDDGEMELGTDYAELLLNSAAQLCRRQAPQWPPHPAERAMIALLLNQIGCIKPSHQCPCQSNKMSYTITSVS